MASHPASERDGQPARHGDRHRQSTRAQTRKAVSNRTAGRQVLSAAGLVGSAAAITGAGIAAWMLPGSIPQPAHAEEGVQTARLTAFTPPPATSPGGILGVFGASPASSAPLNSGSLAGALNLAQQGGPNGAGASAPGVVVAQATPGAGSGSVSTVPDNGLQPTDPLRALGPNFGLPPNQFAINYPSDASVPGCENGCSRIFTWTQSQYPNPFANPMEVNDRNSPQWLLVPPGPERDQGANFLVPPGTTFTTPVDGEQSIEPNGSLLIPPWYVPFFNPGILIKETNPDNIPTSQIQGDPGSTAYSQLASTFGLTPQVAPGGIDSSGGDPTAGMAAANAAAGPSLGQILALGTLGLSDQGNNAFAGSSAGSNTTVAASEPVSSTTVNASDPVNSTTVTASDPVSSTTDQGTPVVLAGIPGDQSAGQPDGQPAMVSADPGIDNIG